MLLKETYQFIPTINLIILSIKTKKYLGKLAYSENYLPEVAAELLFNTWCLFDILWPK